MRTPAASHRRPLEIIILWVDPLEFIRIDRLPGEEYGEGSARSVQTLNFELPDSMICIMYRGSGSRGVQISDSELPESIIRIMFRGSGLGDVQNSNSEHLRGTKYRKMHRIERKNFVESAKSRVGRRERRAGGTLISSEDCRILQMGIEDLQPGCDTPRAPMGAADLRTLRGSRRAVMNPFHM